MPEKYIPEEYWNNRIKAFGEFGDGYIDPEYQYHEDYIRMKKVFDILGDVRGLKVLDAGCGTGRWSIEFAKRGAIVVGVDISKEAIKLAKKRALKSNVKNVVFLNKSLESLDYDNEFDIVISVTVLQHITNDDCLKIAIKNIVKASRDKIVVVESTINWEDFLMNTRPVRFIKNILKKRIIKRQVDFPDNLRNYEFIKLRTKKEWISLFEQNGCKLINQKEVCFFSRYWFPLIKSSRMKNLLKYLDINFAHLKPFCYFSKPTIFYFKKL